MDFNPIVQSDFTKEITSRRTLQKKRKELNVNHEERGVSYVEPVIKKNKIYLIVPIVLQELKV